MSGPRNNLDDVLKRRGLASSTVPALSTSQSQDGSSKVKLRKPDKEPANEYVKPKFRAATKPSAPAQLVITAKPPVQKTPSHSSFSTPGFGKKKPASLAGLSSSPVVVSSADTTPASAQDKRPSTSAATTSTPIAQMITSLPSKRSSPSAFHASEPPSKRPRPVTEAWPSDKENLFAGEEEPTQVSSDFDDIPSTFSKDKGKGREILQDSGPPAFHRNIDFSMATPARHSTRTLSHTPASRPLPRPAGFAPNLRTAASTPDSSSLSSSTNATRIGSVLEEADNGARRTVTLDYSKLLDMSLEDLLDAKRNILDMRSTMIDLLSSLQDGAGAGQVRMMLRDYDNQTQDRIFCIDSLISALRTGRPPSLPPSKWATVPPSAAPVAPPPPLAPSSSRLFDENSMNDVPLPPSEQPTASYEPYDGPSFLEEEPDFDESMDNEAAPQRSYNPPSPVVVDSGPDSDDRLWDQLTREHDEVEVVESAFFQSVASSASSGVTAPSGVAAQPLRPSNENDESQSELMKRPYYKELEEVRNTVFKMKSWRKNQLGVVCSIMDGNDTFNLMPTGGGKSLTFQLPAEVMHRRKRQITLVISPLRALMADQEQALKKKGIKVMCFYGQAEEVVDERDLYDLLAHRQNGPALVYLTPEKLEASQKFKRSLLQLYNDDRIFMVAVDEAHLISSWGRTFRESLGALSWLRENLSKLPIMALTATANAQSRQEIIDTLQIYKCKQFIMSFNRPNLNYVIKTKSGGLDNFVKDIAEFIKSKHNGKTGIVYLQHKKSCEEAAKDLWEKYGIKSRPFHADLSSAQKQKTQAEWQAEKVQVIVATTAFGMGIDKENVRFVIHYALPDALSGYYQETGRAGRDGKPSDCVLYYSYKDVAWLLLCARSDPKMDEATKLQMVDNARRVVQYCLNNTDCRRVQVLSYFGETFPPEMCEGQCDNCRDSSPIQRADVTAEAYKFIQLAQQMRQKGPHATRNMFVECFLGRSTPATKSKGFDVLELFGVCRGYDRGRAERLFDHLTGLGVFEPFTVSTPGQQKFKTEYARLTPKSNTFLRNKETIVMSFRDPPPKAKRATKPKNAPAAKRKGRTQKAAEIADDPIEEGDDETYQPPYFTFPDDMDDRGPVAGPSTRSALKSNSARDVIEVEDDDDDVEILSGPLGQPQASVQPRSRTRTRDDVMEECYKDLVILWNKLASKQNFDSDDFISDEALQYIGTTLPEDIQELRVRLGEMDVELYLVEPYLPALIDVVLKNRANLPQDGARSKPSSSRNIGARSKPPSISELHNKYDMRQGGSDSTSKWPPARKRK